VRRLLTIFLVLVALGAALAALGVVLARDGGRPAHLLDGQRVLAVHLGGEIPDYLPAPPFRWLEGGADRDLAGIWSGLTAARDDRSVRAVAVRIDDLGMGLAKAQELRRELAALVAAGKPVACYLDTAGEGSNGTLEYYVASACSSVSLAPVGELNLLGLWSDPYFLRGGLDKLKIEPSFIAAGRYKSFGETFTETGHSPAAREALDAVLDGYWRQIVSGLADGRQLTPERVRSFFDAAPLSAATALAERLVDHLEYDDELRARLDEQLDDPTWEDLDDYVERRGESRGLPGSGGEIALVFAAGTIVRGASGTDNWTSELFIGSQGLGDLLDQLGDDDGVRAVVLRVDSGGGSAVASDLLHHRVEQLRKKKPVVVSMSDLAASGGYYLAAAASKIVAEPATLTGSIGVVSGKLATGRLESETLGVTRDPLSRGGRAGLYSTSRPYSDEERAVLTARIGEVYDRFLGVVASGRNLPRSMVERVAQGRVWVGEDAKENGLVDELGGLDAALDAARSLAGMKPGAGSVRFYPRSLGFFEWLTTARPAGLTVDSGFVGELLRWRRATRLPGALELPRAVEALARPF